ncbi:hypothetical protein B0T25DRAFT_537103 [Lasiosphaeria hispida]|uniref:Uncharacterized protein n=1 Tax=Lasiosphaeria hispida TaxID=260671 RepID=A0AAJ0MFD6_9PEZI|nr:hypothetical protein B0T25DRAFT_537103 [Lasiosphaeria hispida]
MQLSNSNNDLLPGLGRAIWSWQLCGDYQCGSPCKSEVCPAHNAGRLRRFGQFYRAAVSSYEENHTLPDEIVFREHEDVFQAVILLQQNPGKTRLEIGNLIKRDGTNPGDLFKATDLAAKILTMVNCSTSYLSSDRLEKGNSRMHWKDGIAFDTYLRGLFPTEEHPVFSYPDGEAFADAKGELLGRKLKKHLNLTFRPTHDIRNHLRLDRRDNVLEIYHYTSFVKEHLRLSKQDDTTSNILPRQLLLEVLDSLQGILFPLSDPKSRKLLQSLVATCSLDPDILHFEFSSIRRQGEESIHYVYLADRLSELYNEL